MPRTAPSAVVTIGAAAEPQAAAGAPAAVRVNDASATPQTAASEARHERDVVMTLALSRTCGSPQVELGLAARCAVYPQRPSPCGPSPLWIALGSLFGLPGYLPGPRAQGDAPPDPLADAELRFFRRPGRPGAAPS